MSDTQHRPQMSSVTRGTVLAAWFTLLALWVAPFFFPFRGLSKGFVWRNPLSDTVRHAQCGLERASFPDTCAGRVNGDSGTNETSSCVDLGPTLAKALAAGRPALIDDLEIGDSVSNWFAVNDGNGPQFPMPCTVRSALNGERGPNNALAMHTYGKSDAEFQWAMVGRKLRSIGPRCHHPLDASGFSGVRFWAKGLGAIRVAVATVATTALDHGGTCRQLCYDNHQAIVDLTPAWAQYEVPFADVVQLGFGEPVDLDRSQILDVTWGSVDPVTGFAGSCFDFWVDDVAFYR